MSKWQKSNQIEAINTKHTVPKLKTLQLASRLFDFLLFFSYTFFLLKCGYIQFLHPDPETFLHVYLSQTHLSFSSWRPPHLLNPLAPQKRRAHTHATVQISRFQIPHLAMHDQIETKGKPQ